MGPYPLYVHNSQVISTHHIYIVQEIYFLHSACYDEECSVLQDNFDAKTYARNKVRLKSTAGKLLH